MSDNTLNVNVFVFCSFFFILASQIKYIALYLTNISISSCDCPQFSRHVSVTPITILHPSGAAVWRIWSFRCCFFSVPFVIQWMQMIIVCSSVCWLYRRRRVMQPAVSHRNSTNYGCRRGRHAWQTGMEPWRRDDRQVCGFRIFHSAIPLPTTQRRIAARR